MSGTSTVFPAANYSGSQTCTPVVIDDASTVVQFAIARDGTTIWSQSGTTATATVQVSTDGVNWSSLVGFITAQHDQTNPKDGGTPGFWNIALPPGTGRQVRVILAVANGLAHTSGTLTWQ